MADPDAQMFDQFKRFLQSERNSNANANVSSSPGASQIADGLRSDSSLAQNVNRLFNDSNRRIPQLSSQLPSVTATRQNRRYVPYGRASKKKQQKTYHVKLVIVDYIEEVQTKGKTVHFNGHSLMETPFTFGEMDSDSTIRRSILHIVKSR